MQATLGRARGLMKGFTPGQRAIVVVAGIAVVLGAVALTRWVSQPAWAPLYGSLEGGDANAIVEKLQSDGVAYKLTDGGRTVLVPQGQVYDLRVAMSGAGLPAAQGSDGYSLLDEQGITATDFQQSVAYRRALEGELSTTLEAMDGVRTAVVHLAIPQKDVFATEQDQPTASVLLSLQPGVRLGREQVQSVTHLVAGSVEGLDPADVTVTDSTGAMLSSSTSGAAGASSAASEADEQTALYEDRLSGAVQTMLDQVLGTGRSVVRVSAQLNYDTTDTTSERYLGESAPPLSEATVRETYAGDGGTTGGALGQTQPTLAPVGAEGATDYLRDQRTVNNAVGKVVERVQAAPGQVERLTVAVAVDAKQAGTADTNQVQQLVANAVGLDPRRGDSVQVDKIPFDTTSSEAAAKEIAAAEAADKTQGYIALGTKAGLVLLALVVGFVAFRRRAKRASVEATALDLPQGFPRQLLQRSGGLPALESGGPGRLASSPGEAARLSADDVVREREQMREQVAQLVDNQPDDVAALIQGWLAERNV